MSISGAFFILTRLLQLCTLVPIVGMLSWFVHQYVNFNALTPTAILVLFIVSVLASAWALATLLLYFSARHSARLVALFDLAFVGALIAGVYLLRGPGTSNCSRIEFYAVNGDLGVEYFGNKVCSMLKAAFALGIIDILLFFWTAILALFIARHYPEERVVERTTYRTERHSRRRSSPRRSYEHTSRRSGSRHGSRSSHTRRSVYV